jgi:filamentous hemagglutinin family protein
MVLASLIANPATTVLAQSATPVPQGGQVAQGAATITTPSSSQMVITQTTPRAVINWKDFSIGPDGKVTIQQPGAAAALLNRVTGDNPSLLYGTLQANGQVYLLNPRGIVVGPNGVIDTAAFLGSVLHLSDNAFMSGGAMTFTGSGTAGITNLGRIHAATGDVALLAPAVVNRGTIEAPNGTAALVAGHEILMAPGGPGSLLIKTSLPGVDGSSVENSGVVSAAQAELRAAGSPYALAVNNGGTVSASAVSTRGGRVVLDAGDGDVVNGGALQATAGDRGGAVDVLGGNIALTDTARVDVSGAAGGGAIRIGGGAHGTDASVANARTTTVAEGARLSADAAASGNGGEVVVWSDEATQFAGATSARGAGESGAGGHVEVSGKTLTYAGLTDTTASSGKTGMLLLDPLTIDVDAALAATIAANLATTDVTEQADASVTVSSAISNATTTHNLYLDAPTVAINASILLPAGNLQITSTSLSPRVSVTSASRASIAVKQLNLVGSHPTVTLSGPVTASTSHAVDHAGATVGNVTVTNAANSLNNLDFVGVDNQFTTGNLSFFSNTGMSVSGKLLTGGAISILSGGNLTLGLGSVMTSTGQLTLGSTGIANAFINNNGTSLVGGTGRVVIYTGTTSNGFNSGGLGYTQRAGVSYPSDPLGIGNVIYIAEGGSLPGMTITADNASKLYGSADPLFTASYAGGAATDLTSPVLFSVGGHVNVGTYTITPFGAVSSTRSLQYVPGTLSVTPAPLVISASNGAMTYGSLLPTLSASYSGLVNGDTSSVVSGLTLATTATSRSGVGTYSVLPSGATASNYNISFRPGTLTVNPASLTIVVGDSTRLYGSANPPLTALYSGLVNGDTSSVVSGLALSTSATPQSNVGLYKINASGASAANYTIAYFTGNVVVTPAPLTVTTSSTSVRYGNLVPQLTNSYSGLVNGDTGASLGLSYAVPVVPGTNVGVYRTSLFGQAPNYAISYTPGIITVVPAPLTVAANDASRAYYGPNPTFTGYVVGLMGADKANNLTFTTPAILQSPSGKYAIAPHVDAMPNYDITYLNGTLTVEDLPPLIITMDPHPTQIDIRNIHFEEPYSNIRVADLGNMSLAGLYNLAPDLVALAINDVSACNGGGCTPEIVAIRKKLYEGVLNGTSDIKYAGDIIPFLVSRAKNILDRDPATWSAQEKSLVDYLTRLVTAQKKAAVDQAWESYQAWKAEDKKNAESQGLISLLDTGSIPPDDFLQQATGGVALHGQESAMFMAIVGETSALAASGGITALVSQVGAGAVMNQILPYAAKAATRFIEKAANIALDLAETAELGAAETATAVEEATVAATEIAEGALEVSSASIGFIGGAAVFAISTLIIKGVEIAKANDYDIAMKNARDNAGKPTSVSDLKALLNGDQGAATLFNYVVAATAQKAAKH